MNKSTETREMIEKITPPTFRDSTKIEVMLEILDALNRRMDEMEAAQKRLEESWRISAETANGIQPN